MTIDQDLERLLLQEKLLQFKHFDSQTACAIGSALKLAAEQRNDFTTAAVEMRGFRLWSERCVRTSREKWKILPE